MKFALLASLLFTVSVAQAASYDCFSHEEMGPVHTMTIAEAKMTTDMDGRPYSARVVVVKEGDTQIMWAEAVGTVNSKKIDTILLQGGDMAMGSIKMKRTMTGRHSGTVIVLADTKMTLDMSCVVKK